MKAHNLRLLEQHGFRVPFFTTDRRFEPKGSSRDWIVRSSFGVEDNEAHSFAGAFHSERVGDANATTIAAAVERVLASYDAAGLQLAHCAREVIIQHYVHGQISGVAFSRCLGSAPHFEEGVVEWAAGPCEGVTSGEAPTTRVRLSAKAPRELRPFFRALVRGLQKLERLFDSPVDVEWTYDGKHLWWLQVRPIAGEAPLLWQKSKGGARFVREKIAERFPDVMTPMGWSLIEETLEHAMHSMVHYTGFECRHVERASILYRGLAYGNDNYFRYPNCALQITTLKSIVARTLGFLLQRPRAHFLARLLHHVYLNDCNQRVLQDWHDKLPGHIAAIRNFKPQPRNLSEGLEQIQALRALSFAYFQTDLAIYFLKEASLWLLTRAGVDASGLARFANNQTLVMQQRANELGRIAQFSAAQAAKARFLEDFGHVREGWDLTHKALSDNSEAFDALIASMANCKDAAERVSSEHDAPPVLLKALYEQARALCEADEEQHFYAGLYVQKSQALLAVIADLLIDAHYIDERSDLFFLTATELEDFLRMPRPLRDLVRSRRSLFERQSRAGALRAASSQSNQLFHGLATSSGKGEGVLHFARTFQDLAQMPSGAVLCLDTPNPSFAPWFHLCSAIVCEQGGLLSHGFIAAREMQIPAISGIALATLPFGTTALVDGTTGTLLLSDVVN